jgi:hypothetical protein
MRIKPAHQRLITDVSRLRPHRCAIIITTIRSPQLTESSRSACALTKDIRAIQTKLLKAFVWIGSQGECEAFVRTPLAIVQVHEFVDWVSVWEEVQDARQQLRQVYRPH